MRNKAHARQILEENAAQCEMDVYDYTVHSASEDPTFYTFLFPDENIGDYGIGMTKEQEKEASEFIESLK